MVIWVRHMFGCSTSGFLQLNAEIVAQCACKFVLAEHARTAVVAKLIKDPTSCLTGNLPR